MTKVQYQIVAKKLNEAFSVYFDKTGKYPLTPHVEVIDTKGNGYGFSDYSLMLNDDAYDLLKGDYRSPEIVKRFGAVFNIHGDRYYLEPVNSMVYDIAKL